MYSGVNTLTCSDGDLGIQRFDDAGRTYVHVLNYRYDKERDAVATAPEVRFSIGRTVGGVSVRTLDGHVPEHAVVRRGDSLDVTIRDLPLYTLLEIGE
jgi:hypothetical protein